MDPQVLQQAAEWIAGAGALLITTGAGMGVDSGLPDFRGKEGFWRAYPPLARLGLDFPSMANPAWFRRDPALAWGFYGHRLSLYRKTKPHQGYAILYAWAMRMQHGAFCFTSNVDGALQKAGFMDRVFEVHGSIFLGQCINRCGADVFSLEHVQVEVNMETLRALPPWPSCPECGGLARPAILMFGDTEWNSRPFDAQAGRMRKWLEQIDPSALVVVECGAGLAIPTVRHMSEHWACRGAKLIRINPREPDVPSEHLGFASGAMVTLEAIDKFLNE